MAPFANRLIDDEIVGVTATRDEGFVVPGAVGDPLDDLDLVARSFLCTGGAGASLTRSVLCDIGQTSQLTGEDARDYVIAVVRPSPPVAKSF